MDARDADRFLIERGRGPCGHMQNFRRLSDVIATLVRVKETPLRPPVFDTLDRVDPRPADHLETSFQFLNRVAGDYWAQVRELVQRWLDHVAEDTDYRDLRGRLRDDDAMNYSAFLELYLHELFRRAGYDIMVHPHVAGSRRHPDFLIQGHGEAFYVEAVMPGPPRAGHGQGQRRAAFLDTIQRCENRYFYLSLDHLIVGPTPARGRRARDQIERWLARLDPDKVSYDLDRRESIRWEDQGWEAEFSAIPVSREHRGKSDHRLIGVYADGEAQFVDDAPTLRATLATKATAYGDLDRPLIIALGTYLFDRDRWHATNALYGHEAVTSWANTDGTTGTTSTRQADGFFGTPPTWTNQGVSAVLHLNQLQPHHAQHAEVTLWPHPALTNQVNGLATRIPTITISASEDVLEKTPSAIDPAEHFDIPNPWPAGEAFPRP